MKLTGMWKKDQRVSELSERKGENIGIYNLKYFLTCFYV